MIEIIMELLTYFIIYSFLGWVLESVYKSLLIKSFVNSGFLYGPFCPIYGIGALVMHLFLNEFKEQPFIVFIIGVFVLSFWEYIVGLFLEKIFKTKYWDYSDKKFNFQGRICLSHSIIWGTLGLLFIEFIHPFVQNQISYINTNVLYIFDIVVAILIIIDAVVSIIKGIKIKDKVKYIEELNERIREKLEELKKYADIPEMAETKEKIQKILNNLNSIKEKQLKRMHMYAKRIKDAFPTIKSDFLIKLANEKVDFIKHKKNKQ